MKDPIILRHKHPLSPNQARYWKDLLYRVTKVGTELEVAPPKGMKRPVFEEQISEALHPSNDFECLGRTGVLDVKTEHCGIEIRVIGRQPYFPNLHSQYQRIMAVLSKAGSRPRATCGLHFHLLTPGLGEPVPEVIIANLWNLTRRYAPELKWITSGGESLAGLCRRRNYNSHLELVQHSPVMTSMAEIQHILKKSRAVPEHQNFLNLEHLRFDDQGNVLPFHVEFRFPDADLSPSSVTAKTFLFLALLLKSVDLSQYGVIHVGKVSPWRRKVEVLNLLSNNDGNLATSDTSGLTDEMIEELRQGMYELLDLLEPTFSMFNDNPAWEILRSLTEHPISLLRSAGYDWQSIEALLVQRSTLDDLGLDDTDRELMQHIELGEWNHFSSQDCWCWHAARELYLTPQNLENRLQQLEKLRGLRWDSRQGAMVFTS